MPRVPPEATMPGRWVDAAYLRVGDSLFMRNGDVVSIASLKTSTLNDIVYNFEVEPFHTYAVGNASLLVHNSNGAEPLAKVWKTAAECAEWVRKFVGKDDGAAVDLVIRGNRFVDYSHVRDIGDLHPAVQDALKYIFPKVKGNPLQWFGQCAEVGAVDQAIRAFGGDIAQLRGGFSRAINIADDSFKPPCDACKLFLKYFGIGY